MNSLVNKLPCGKTGRPTIQNASVYHSEFISESRIFNVLHSRQILKQVQDDNCRTACKTTGYLKNLALNIRGFDTDFIRL
jgi:hypothetical protein